MTFAREALSVESWPAICALLKPALDESDYSTPEEVIDGLLDGRFDMWVRRLHDLPQAVAIAEPQNGYVEAFAVGGRDMEEWVDDLADAVLAAGKPLGITKIRIHGRPGWERVLGRRGWKRCSVIMERN